MTIGEALENENVELDAFENLLNGKLDAKLEGSNNWESKEAKALEIVKKKADLNHLRFVDVSKEKLPYDCIYGITKVDVKGETKIPFQMSLGFETKEGKWLLPGYLREKDVDLWMFEVESEAELYIPNWQIRKIAENPESFGTIYWKDRNRDYFGRKHKMLILNKHLIQKSNRFVFEKEVMYR